MDIFEIGYDKKETRRGSFRIKANGLSAVADGMVMAVEDISHTGMFVHTDMPTEKTILADILVSGNVKAKAVPCAVVRRTKGGTGLQFLHLDRQTQMSIDKVVLNLQKAFIETKKTASSELHQTC